MDVDETAEGKRRRVASICEILNIEKEEEQPYVNERAEPVVPEGAIEDDCVPLVDGLPADLVKAGDEKGLTNMSELAVFEWIEEKGRAEGRKKLVETGWARKMKGAEVRSRCVLRDYAVSKRDDVFAPTPCPTAVRTLLFFALVFDLAIQTADLISAFMQAPGRKTMYARPPKSIRVAGWAWKILKAR